MKMEQTECFEMSAYKIQTPGNYPEESVQHSEHDESAKSRIIHPVVSSVSDSVGCPVWYAGCPGGRGCGL